MGDSKPKVNKAKMFEKAAEEKPLGETEMLIIYIPFVNNEKQIIL